MINKQFFLRNAFAIIFICSFWNENKAQQLPIFTQYRQNMPLINPAVLSSAFFMFNDYSASFGLSYRTQWIEEAISPKTFSFHGAYRINLQGKSKTNLILGMNFINDEIGPLSLSNPALRIAGVVYFDSKSNHGISLGFQVGGIQYNLNSSKIQLLDPRDVFILNDRVQWEPTLSFGLYYFNNDFNSNGDSYYGGISVPQVFGFDTNFSDSNEALTINSTPHYYGIFGYQIITSSKSFIEPYMWIKYVQGIVNVDLNLRYLFERVFWAGGGVNNSGVFHLESGIIIGGKHEDAKNLIEIGYSLNVSAGEVGRNFGTPHELNLALTLRD